MYIYLYSEHCAENKEREEKMKKYCANNTKYIHTARQDFRYNSMQQN